MTYAIFSSYMRKFAEVVLVRPILAVSEMSISHVEPDMAAFGRSLLQPFGKCYFGHLKAKWYETNAAW